MHLPAPRSIIDKIRAIATPEDMEAVDAELRADDAPLSKEVQAALVDKLREVTQTSKAARQQAISILNVHGVDYPLTDWLTPSNYAKRFGIKNTETVLGWINRGVIGAEHIKEIPELGLRLIRAVEYSPRKYTNPKEVAP